ncbi:hypothetical protein M408DRAFT_271981 [Serendipita vermifera MAFF 305830]|uniref:Uncharacterized protein n=1 Tax=Serendipita vermifera MAFF 305830 TaxID=933852 RepID=A0A0C3BFE1_SERVB|nr:hypothetical protein M408DRAFT_271981 [Serendipita vermifera MAFF 305830]
MISLVRYPTALAERSPSTPMSQFEGDVQIIIARSSMGPLFPTDFGSRLTKRGSCRSLKSTNYAFLFLNSYLDPVLLKFTLIFCCYTDLRWRVAELSIDLH